MPVDPAAQQILATALSALVAALGLDRWFKRRARPADIRRCSIEAIDAVALAIEEGDLVLPAEENEVITDWLLDEWQERFREILDDEQLRITDHELRMARSRASARMVSRAIDASTKHSRELGRAAVAMSTPRALRKPIRTTDPPWTATNGESKDGRR